MDRKFAIRQLSETMRYDPFTIDPRLQQAYDSFIQLQGTRARPIWEWHLPYLRWRWELRSQYDNLAQVQYASQKERVWMREANKKLINDAERLKRFGDTSLTKREEMRRWLLRGPQAKAYYQQQNDALLKGLDREAEAVLAEVENSLVTSRALSRFFDRYVHDSYAGFWPSVPEATGYWRYRKGFYGDDNATIVQQKPGPHIA
jgi:hypothetical protein